MTIVQVIALYHAYFCGVLAGDRKTAGGGCERDRLGENGSKKTPCTQEVTKTANSNYS